MAILLAGESIKTQFLVKVESFAIK